jgi:glycine oxidase
MIVVGAGIIGLSCAWRLALCRIPVKIFDSGLAGGEASWAGAGMLAPGGEFEEASPLTDMALTSLSMYPEFVDALRQEAGLPIDYRRCGAIELARDEVETDHLVRRAAWQTALGIRSEAVTWPLAAAARFYPDDAVVNPREVVAALRAACLRRGVDVHEREPVLEIFPDGSGVRTTLMVYHDAGVLISAGAWSSSLAAPFRLPAVSPVRGHLVSWEAEPGLLATILRCGNTYVLQRATGTIVAGSSTEYAGFDRTVDETIANDIHRRAASLLPELSTMSPAEKWIGFRPSIDGGVPRVGRIDGTAVWTAFGHYRNGILLAPETARRIEKSVVVSL